MRRVLFGFVLLFALIVSPLAGMLPASAQEATPTTTSSAQADAPEMVPITDPWVDPVATLDDAFFFSIENDPVASEISGTTELQVGEYQFLPADVALADFYTELYYDAPALPEGSDFAVGFCFWVEVDGSCYDIGVQSDAAGNTSVISGYAPAVGDYQLLVTTTSLADSGVDPTPGAENYLGLVVYEGYAILEGNNYEILAVIALPDAAVAGKVKAQIGFVDRGLPANTPPLSVTIGELMVWDLSAGVTPVFAVSEEGTPTAEPATIGTATAVPPLRPTTAPQPTVASQSTANASLTPVVPTAQGVSTLAAVFERTRSVALGQTPLVSGKSGTLSQQQDIVVRANADASVADFYAIATFVNPTDLSVPSDIGLGFRVQGSTDPGYRFIVASTGEWYLISPTEIAIASGTAPSFDTAPGASNTLEILAQGAAGLVAVNGTVLPQVDLSALMTAGDVYAGTGFLTGNTVAGRAVPYSDWWVYPL